MKYYSISEDDLKGLITRDWELLELEINGVDNWPGYGEGEEVTEEEVVEYMGTAFKIFKEE